MPKRTPPIARSPLFAPPSAAEPAFVVQSAPRNLRNRYLRRVRASQTDGYSGAKEGAIVDASVALARLRAIGVDLAQALGGPGYTLRAFTYRKALARGADQQRAGHRSIVDFGGHPGYLHTKAGALSYCATGMGSLRALIGACLSFPGSVSLILVEIMVIRPSGRGIDPLRCGRRTFSDVGTGLCLSIPCIGRQQL